MLLNLRLFAILMFFVNLQFQSYGQFAFATELTPIAETYGFGDIDVDPFGAFIRTGRNEVILSLDEGQSWDTISLRPDHLFITRLEDHSIITSKRVNTDTFTLYRYVNETPIPISILGDTTYQLTHVDYHLSLIHI